MKTIFTTEDIKNIIKNIFNEHKSETLKIVGEEGDIETPIVDYLGIDFYTWKNRVVTYIDDDNSCRVMAYDKWANEFKSLDRVFALIEIANSSIVPSPDIDSATYESKITVLIQPEKVPVLEEFLASLRAEYAGKREIIQNNSGEKLDAYITFGSLVYEEAPKMTTTGAENVVVSFGFGISYLTSALNYDNLPVSIGFNGVNGKFYPFHYTKLTMQNIYNGHPVPLQERPNFTGLKNSSMGVAFTFSYYDFNDEIAQHLNDVFFLNSANFIGGAEQGISDVNNIIWVMVFYNGSRCFYKCVIDNMEKTVTNSDFVSCTLSLKGAA